MVSSMEATPMAGLAGLSIIPDSSSSSAATPLVDNPSLAPRPDDSSAPPQLADRAKRVYGARRPFHRPASPPVPVQAQEAEVVPETVESRVRSPPKTVDSESSEFRVGRSSPSPSGLNVGRGSLLPGLTHPAPSKTAKPTSDSEEDVDELDDDDDGKEDAGTRTTAFKSDLRAQLANIDNSSSPPHNKLTSHPSNPKPRPSFVAPQLQVALSSSDLSSVPPSTGQEGVDTSLETMPTSPNNEVDNEVDDEEEEEGEGDAVMQESMSQLPLSHAAKKSKSKSKKHRIIDSSDSDSDSNKSAAEDSDALPTVDEELAESKRRAKRKLEMEEKAAKKRAQSEEARRKKEGKKKAVVESEEEGEGEEEMQKEEEGEGKKKKRKVKGLSKKELEETRRDVAALERKKDFVGIASGTRDLKMDLNSLLQGQRSAATSALEARSRSRKAASVLESKYARKQTWSGQQQQKEEEAKGWSSPIEDDWSSQPNGNGSKVIELGSSNVSSQPAEGRRPGEPIELKGSSEDDSSEEAPSRNVARDVWPSLKPEPKPTTSAAAAAAAAAAEDYDSDELPDGDLWEVLKAKEVEKKERQRKMEELDAKKAKALAAQLDRRAAQDSDSDSDFEVVNTAETAPARKTVPDATPKASHRPTKGAETIRKFADRNHRHPLRHDSQGHLTESMLISNSQMHHMGRAVHLRGEEKPSLSGGGTKRTGPVAKPVKPNQNVIEQTLLLKVRRENARIGHQKQEEWVKKGGRLATEKIKSGDGTKADEEEQVKAALERTKMRKDEGEEDEDEDDESWKGEEEEEEDAEMEEMSGESEDEAGSGSEGGDEEGEEQGSGSEAEAEVEEDEEEEEEEKVSDDAASQQNDENAPPLSASQSDPSLVPTVVEQRSGDLAFSPSTSRAGGRLPLSQLDGYVSPPATPPEDTSPVFGQVPLPGFAFPAAAGSDAATSVTDESQVGLPGFLGAKGAAPAGGLSQFFGDEFTQAHGKRVGERGFAQAEIDDAPHEPTQCLLPGVEVLPEEHDRDAVRLAGAAMFRESTPTDDRPELYLNDEGLLTQHKPRHKTPEATPMSQISTRIPFGMLRQAQGTVSTIRDEESQGLGPPSIIQPRRLVRAEESALALDPDHAPPPQQRQRRRIVEDDDDASSAKQDGGDSGDEMPPSKVPVNAFTEMMQSKRRASSPSAEDRKAKKARGAGAGDFLADAAEESEDEVYGKMGGGDEEEDDSDDGSIIENLVDDEQVSAEERAKQDELAAEKARADEEAESEKRQKMAEALAKGDIRRKQGKKAGAFDDSDDEDDEEHARNEFNRRHENKKAKPRDDIEALRNDERTAAFANVYKETTAVEMGLDDHSFLNAEPMALDQEDGSSDDGYGEDEPQTGGLFAGQGDRGGLQRKRPAMDPWNFDDEPERNPNTVLAGPSSSPKMEIAYNLHNKVARGNSHGGADRNFTKGGGNHDDLDSQYDSQGFAPFSERIMALGHELGTDDKSSRNTGGGGGATKSSAITSMVSRGAAKKPTSSAKPAVGGKAKATTAVSAGGMRSGRADLMQPRGGGAGGSLAKLRTAKGVSKGAGPSKSKK